jgi:hypothetical protein
MGMPDGMTMAADDVCAFCEARRSEHGHNSASTWFVNCPRRFMAAHIRRDFSPAPQVSVKPATRKDHPLFSGCMAYFPDALLAVSKLSKIGNDKHNPGERLHWSREKSADHADCLARHLVNHGQTDPDTGLSHTTAVAWRALALLQTEIERAGRAAVDDAPDVLHAVADEMKAAEPRRSAGRKRVYIAGPITRGDLAHNINQGTEAFVKLAKAGFAPHAPQWSACSGRVWRIGSDLYATYPSAKPNELKHADWLSVDLEYVAISDAVLRLPGESKGADQEVAEAKRLGIPVYYAVEDVVAHVK